MHSPTVTMATDKEKVGTAEQSWKREGWDKKEGRRDEGREGEEEENGSPRSPPLPPPLTVQFINIKVISKR